ncbi:GreA/GreB family elongation factor [Paenibacillus sp. FSL F4-0125]|uniref:GreA/GreB family elongation factor n=1 Tax=Paenibacillus sp. FSL F4-0125 TaxID=2954730 RepID=UPI0030F7323C
MNHSLIYEGSRTQLVQQLIYFDEEKIAFLNQYFPERSKQRSNAETLLSRYCSELEQLLSRFNGEELNSLVLIGSQLQLRYLDDNTTDTYTIVFPNQAEPNDNKISMFSPIGMQLLLAQIGSTCLLAIPSGELSVMIESIKFVNCGEVAVLI